MARRIPTSDVTSDVRAAFQYIVDTPVGAGADNKNKPDVQLVQLFLNAFYKSHPELFAKLPKLAHGDQSEIGMDGQVGPQTVAGITEFQKFVIRTGKSGVFVDGRVSVPHGGFRVATTKHVFTIFQLSTFFFLISPFNAQFNANLEEHPIVAGRLPELAAELTRNSD